MKNTPNVAFVRPEVKNLLPQYITIKDCLDGEVAVKNKKSIYLPVPNDESSENENTERYENYIKRAVFYGVTARTLDGFIGQIFAKEPLIQMPEGLEFLLDDADGSGSVGIVSMAKSVCRLVVPFGRAGLFVDYPGVDDDLSIEEVQSGRIQPMIKYYDSASIVNWRKELVNGKRVYSLVVLKEKYIWNDDGFEFKMADQWRVLRLVGNEYEVSIWRNNEQGSHFLSHGPFYPTDSNGNRFDFIPFEFIGSIDNEAEPDNPPMYSIASLNLAHYRNSADYEESCFIVGQPTPYFSGLDENWVKNVLKGTIQLGARSAVPLPQGGLAGLLQPNPNIMPMEAMLAKEKQMVALGARIVEQRNVERTLGEAAMEHAAETSVLANVASNVSKAFVNAIATCGLFTGVDTSSCVFSLNTDFAISRISTQDRAQLMLEWQAGALTFGEMRSVLKDAKIASVQNDNEARTSIIKELPEISPNTNVKQDVTNGAGA